MGVGDVTAVAVSLLVAITVCASGEIGSRGGICDGAIRVRGGIGVSGVIGAVGGGQAGHGFTALFPALFLGKEIRGRCRR